MRYIDQLLIEFEKRGDPLTQTIPEEEIPVLIESLKSRLGLTTKELDLTPKSLSLLAKNLINYHKLSTDRGLEFKEEDHIRIVREIAAYFGEVVLVNSRGKKKLISGLRGMEIVFEEPSKVIKENEVQTYPKWIINIGQIAAGAWDAVLLGIEPKLFKGYQISVSPNVRENL